MNEFNPAGTRAPVAETTPSVQQDLPPRSAAAKKKRERRRRTSDDIDLNMKLGVPKDAKDPAYEYRWINDTSEGRIAAKTKMDDWDIVKSSKLGDYKDVVSSLDEGTAIKRAVGTGAQGQPLFAYLCRKPKEYHEQDKQAEQVKLDELDSQIQRGQMNDPEALSREHSYLPGGENTVKVTTG